MSNLMKKIVASVLGLALVVSCLTASAATVSVNETTTEANGKVSVVVTAADFAAVAGQELTVTLPEGTTIVSVKATKPAGWTLEAGENYVINGNTVKIVDVFNLPNAPAADELEITIAVNAPATDGEYDVTVTGKSVDANENFIESTYANGKITVAAPAPAEEEVEVEGDQDVNFDNDTKFVPYGAAYYVANDEIVYLEKNEDGSFAIPEGVTNVTITKFELPAEGEDVTTFGVSKNTDDETNAIQFGSFAITADGTSFGTLYVIGDFDGALAALAAKNYTAASFVEKLNTLFDSNVGAEGKFLKVTLGGSTIYVGKKTQTAVMWEGETARQYALRLYNVDVNTIYTAVGYSVDGTTFNFSNEIVSAVYSALN